MEEIKISFDQIVIDYNTAKLFVRKPTIVSPEMILKKIDEKDMKWFIDNKIEMKLYLNEDVLNDTKK